ncbi:NAD(P)/FAD-dependent oxidoreductase [Amorphus orientalis]|uniref:3-phenylpropionate/trans-cinnamate dioxygenase ferredoxin reductase subunit n=1 Tax=Amorphus orientalis TaxID=649198 RepID=A0AAE3VP85_9HYPH|nr:FAD-dependent oxidoreductase [Amorphus orientalis]MDQ0315754.1 3-phenylpropionate/trans-cinnamate dioxygenase ferredoxin reductase subunit [Amorphus orientalis]
MTDAPILVVGAGQCGLKAVETLRASGYDGDLVFIGAEPHAPYQRPPLSKAFLKGEMTRDRLMLKPDRFFQEQRIETRFGEAVATIAPDRHQVTLAGGDRLAYSKLLLATGTRARRIPLEGADLAGVFHLRDLADVEWIAANLDPSMRLAIVGAGYIGLEVAAALRVAGYEVTVLEGAERILRRVVCPEISAFFDGLHRDHGVDIRTSTLPVRIVGAERVEAVELADGTSLACDAVLLAVGAEPVTDLAGAARIACDNGILVDTACRTSAPDVFAAGDCAAFPSARYGRTIRLESVQNAIDQGKAAAQAMLGTPVAYDPLPWFWSDQYHVKLQIVGLSEGHSEAVIDGVPSDSGFSVTYLKNGAPIAVDAVNQPRAHMLARRSLAAPVDETAMAAKTA